MASMLAPTPELQPTVARQTSTSARAVMACGMALIRAGMLWAAQAPPNGSFWQDLAGPFFVAGIGTAFAFIPISIGGLTGVTERDAGVASGLLNTSQNLGGAIGVAVASSITASHLHTLIQHGYAPSAALAGGSGRAGLFLTQSALNAGKLVAAQPGISIMDPVVSVAWGILVFGEQIRAGLLILPGVLALALIGFAAFRLARSPLLADH
jgi:hypothetical protein